MNRSFLTGFFSNTSEKFYRAAYITVVRAPFFYAAKQFERPECVESGAVVFAEICGIFSFSTFMIAFVYPFRNAE